MKKKTPLAELVSKLNKAGESNPHLGFNLAAKWAKELLPEEREMVEDAYGMAKDTGFNGESYYTSAKQYFNEKYGQ